MIYPRNVGGVDRRVQGGRSGMGGADSILARLWERQKCVRRMRVPGRKDGDSDVGEPDGDIG